MAPGSPCSQPRCAFHGRSEALSGSTVLQALQTRAMAEQRSSNVIAFIVSKSLGHLLRLHSVSSQVSSSRCYDWEELHESVLCRRVESFDGPSECRLQAFLYPFRCRAR